MKSCRKCGRPKPLTDFPKRKTSRDGRDKVLAEIAKCELVCANCHRVRTHTDENVEMVA